MNELPVAAQYAVVFVFSTALGFAMRSYFKRTNNK